MLGSALKNLGEESAPIGQNFAGEIGRDLDEAGDPQLIGFPVAGRIRRHVGEDHVGPAAEPILEKPWRIWLRKSNTLKSAPVSGSMARRSMPMTLPWPCSAPPSARPPATTPPARRQDRQFFGPVLGNDSGRRPQAAYRPRGNESLPLGSCHIGIVELALEPQGRGKRPLPRGLDPRFKRAPAFAPGGRFCFNHAETQVKRLTSDL